MSRRAPIYVQETRDWLDIAVAESHYFEKPYGYHDKLWWLVSCWCAMRDPLRCPWWKTNLLTSGTARLAEAQRLSPAIIRAIKPVMNWLNGPAPMRAPETWPPAVAAVFEPFDVPPFAFANAWPRKWGWSVSDDVLLGAALLGLHSYGMTVDDIQALILGDAADVLRLQIGAARWLKTYPPFIIWAARPDLSLVPEVSGRTLASCMLQPGAIVRSSWWGAIKSGRFPTSGAILLPAFTHIAPPSGQTWP